MLMKKVLLMLMALFSFNFNVFCMLGMESEKKEIPLKEDKNVNADETRPRTSVLIPIACYYDNGVISLEPLADLGEIRLTVINQNSGEEWRNEEGALYVFTSTQTGVYWVEIVTESGDTYYGTYTL